MRRLLALAGGVCLLASVGATAQTATPSGPVTTGTLAELCGSDAPGAMAFCRGVMVGAGQYHMSITTGPGARRPIFCLPGGPPTFDEAQSSFTAWVRANPQHAGERAVDGLMRWAAATYPCPPPAARGQARR
jgi:hypothetical protein